MASPYANWSATAYYKVNDIVQYAGGFYQAIVANIGVTPSASSPWSNYTPPGQFPAGVFVTNNGPAVGQWNTSQNPNSTYAQATISGIGASITGTSAISATLQTIPADNVTATIADIETHWLIASVPSSANGGSITFVLSGGVPLRPADLYVSWAVTKY
jgi:hypothetical protein